MAKRIVKTQLNLVIDTQSSSFAAPGAQQYQAQYKTFLPSKYNLNNFRVDAIDFTSIGKYIPLSLPNNPQDYWYGANGGGLTAFLTLFDGKNNLVLNNYPLIDLLNNVYYDSATQTNVIKDPTFNRLRLFKINGINTTLSYITIQPPNQFYTVPSNFGTLNIYQFE